MGGWEEERNHKKTIILVRTDNRKEGNWIKILLASVVIAEYFSAGLISLLLLQSPSHPKTKEGFHNPLHICRASASSGYGKSSMGSEGNILCRVSAWPRLRDCCPLPGSARRKHTRVCGSSSIVCWAMWGNYKGMKRTESSFYLIKALCFGYWRMLSLLTYINVDCLQETAEVELSIAT